MSSSDVSSPDEFQISCNTQLSSVNSEDSSTNNRLLLKRHICVAGWHSADSSCTTPYFQRTNRFKYSAFTKATCACVRNLKVGHFRAQHFQVGQLQCPELPPFDTAARNASDKRENVAFIYTLTIKRAASQSWWETLIGTLKMRDMKCSKMRHNIAGVKNTWHENARNTAYV